MGTDRPLVTVIVTVFVRTNYLEEALRSAVAQSFRDLEIIVTDDSNSSATRNICNNFASDRRVRYRANKSVFGAPLNVAAALYEAKGEYVTILNDDDVMEPFMVDTLLPPFQTDKDCVVSFADHWIIDAHGSVLMNETTRNSRFWGRAQLGAGKVEKPFGLALRGRVPFVMGTIFRRCAYCEQWLVPEVAGAYDHWVALQLSLSGGGFYFNPTRVLRYRVHGASETARLDAEKTRAQVFIFSQLANDTRAQSEYPFIYRMLAHFLFVLGRDRLYFNDQSSARRAFRGALRYRISLKPLLGIVFTFIPGVIHRTFVRWWRLARGIRAEPPKRTQLS